MYPGLLWTPFHGPLGIHGPPSLFRSSLIFYCFNEWSRVFFPHRVFTTSTRCPEDGGGPIKTHGRWRHRRRRRSDRSASFFFSFLLFLSCWFYFHFGSFRRHICRPSPGRLMRFWFHRFLLDRLEVGGAKLAALQLATTATTATTTTTTTTKISVKLDRRRDWWRRRRRPTTSSQNSVKLGKTRQNWVKTR